MIHSQYKSSCGGFLLEIHYMEFDPEIPYFDWGWSLHLHTVKSRHTPDFLKREHYTLYESDAEVLSAVKTLSDTSNKHVEHKHCELVTDSYIVTGILCIEDELTLGEKPDPMLPDIIKTLQEWLNGEVYGFVMYDLNKEITSKFPGISKEEYITDSCRGYYGDSGIEQILDETQINDQPWIKK